MKFISSVSAPFVWLLSVPTAFILKLFKVKASVEPPVTDEEIKGLIDVGTKAGVFEQTEQNLIESVIGLGDQRITSLMTPRTNIVWLDLEDSTENIRQKLTESRFSRMPAAKGSLDNILGYASAKALLGQLIKENEISLDAVLQQPFYVPETLTILELLERFRESHTHFAIIVDEFGGVEGLVTINDILEAIIGELPNSQHILPEQGVLRRKDGSFIFDGRISIHDFKETLGLKELPAEERDTYQTLGGFVLTRLGRIPKAGERFVWNNYEFEIISMAQNRVDKVLILPEAAKQQS